MKYLCTLILCCSHLLVSLAQEPTTDQLSAELKQLFNQRNHYSPAQFDSLLATYPQEITVPEQAQDQINHFTLSCLRAYAQRRFGNYATSNEILTSLLTALDPQNTRPPQFIVEWAYSLIGKNYRNLRDQNQALQWVDEGLALLDQHYPNPDSIRVELYLLRAELSPAYTEEGYSFVQAAADSYQAIPEWVDSVQLFQIQVTYANQSADAYQGVRHADQALALGRKIYGQDNNELALIYFNTANLYRDLNQYEKAQVYLERAAYIIETQTSMRFPLIHIWSTLGQVHQELEDYDSSISYYEQSLGISAQIMGPEAVWQGIGLMQLAEVQIEAGELSEAKTNLLASQAIINSHPQEGYYLSNLSKTEALLGQTARLEGQLAAAIEHFEKSLELSAYDPSYRAPRIDQFAGCYGELQQWGKADSLMRMAYQALPYADAFELPDAFLIDHEPFLRIILTEGRLAFQQYQVENDPALLELSRALYERLFQGLKAIQREYPETASIANFRREWFPIYDEALQLYLEGETEADAIFGLLESSANALLLGQLRAHRLADFSNIAPAEMEQEDRWQDSLLQIRRQRLAQDQHEGADLIVKETNFQDSLDRLRRGFAQQNPAWYQLRYEQPTISLAAIQSQLRRGELLLQYRLNADNALVFYATRDQAGVHRLPANIDTQLARYLPLLQRAELSNTEDNLLAYSQELFQVLIGDVLPQISGPLNSLTIIPDGKLHFLPFEALQPSANHWLIQDFPVRYTSSASVLVEQMLAISPARRPFLGVAPQYQEEQAKRQSDTATDAQMALLLRSGNYALPGAQQEVQELQNLLGGKALIGPQASKARFLAEAEAYQILHLAMHGLVAPDDPLNSRLIFSSEGNEQVVLTAAEIYQQKLAAQLAVLSACNTGTGTLTKGEGVMSISRAFAYAGVPSTVMSLWRVPDAATAQIMSSFYRGLAAGQPKDEALQAAKIDYLTSVAETPELQQPYFWAGFVLNGNLDPLTFRRNNKWWFLAGMILLLGALIYWRKRS